MKKRGKKREIKISRIYFKSWKFIKSIKNYILVVCCLFAFSIIFGLLFPGLFEQQILNIIRDIMLKSLNLKGFDLVGFIFMNNLQTSVIGVVSGIFFGIFPVILILVNGYVIGYVINRTILIAGPGVLWRLLPHGIFELPAVIISLGIGLKLGMFFRYAKYKTRAFLAQILGFFSFIILSYISLLSILLTTQTILLDKSVINDNLEKSMSNPYFIVILPLIFIISVLVQYFIFKREDKKSYLMLLKKSIIAFIFIVIPLLMLAGLIEGFLMTWI